MPEALERKGEGLAKHLHATPGSERWNAIKYGSMRSAGWKPKREKKGVKHGK